jgi:hypothetical protein
MAKSEVHEKPASSGASVSQMDAIFLRLFRNSSVVILLMGSPRQDIIYSDEGSRQFDVHAARGMNIKLPATCNGLQSK